MDGFWVEEAEKGLKLAEEAEGEVLKLVKWSEEVKRGLELVNLVFGTKKPKEKGWN